MKVLASLKVIDLFDNPAAHEPNYKMRLLNELRSVEIHDKHKVSVVEKDEAIKFMSESAGRKKKHRPFAW